ncbi:MAG: glycine cleavage system protein T [Sneathiella sp.]|uniref:CAF17-like 4Fe-4S cluster assembly/insertion protein YgfZ n=1 Tax=Sneathiella sp. TaxID=1964365 RepID=UPI000C571616|nr:hypothetical protein [Sneathiella sp.]MAZ02644.1 glycine cleavage system protein T [Sneathiella sp.]|tara:strand:+ start:509 stop:1399 length:891 start_codon:yes stop_codon:yes gene_type:complete
MSDLSITALKNRTILALTGKDVWDFLQNLVTNDMKMVNEAQCLYAALLTAQGKFLHDFIIIKQGETFMIDCATERKDDLIRRLTLYKLRSDVTLTETASQVFAVYGDGAYKSANLPEKAGTVIQNGNDLYLVDPRNANLGVRIITTADFNAADDFPAATVKDEGSYEAHRLYLGIPEGGQDIIPEKNFLLEANFEELNGVSFTKGCYVGQELTARTKHRAKIKKRLLRVLFDGSLEPGDAITLDGREIAEVRSFANGQGIALVRLENLPEGPAALKPEGVKLILPEYINLPIAEKY